MDWTPASTIATVIGGVGMVCALIRAWIAVRRHWVEGPKIQFRGENPLKIERQRQSALNVQGQQRMAPEHPGIEAHASRVTNAGSVPVTLFVARVAKLTCAGRRKRHGRVRCIWHRCDRTTLKRIDSGENMTLQPGDLADLELTISPPKDEEFAGGSGELLLEVPYQGRGSRKRKVRISQPFEFR